MAESWAAKTVEKLALRSVVRKDERMADQTAEMMVDQKVEKVELMVAPMADLKEWMMVGKKVERKVVTTEPKMDVMLGETTAKLKAGNLVEKWVKMTVEKSVEWAGKKVEKKVDQTGVNWAAKKETRTVEKSVEN